MNEPASNHALWDAARSKGDPPADAVIASLGREVWAVNALLASVDRNDAPLPDGLPRGLYPLVRPALPAWADAHRLRSAQSFARENLFAITVALFCTSLPLSYLAKGGARVLWRAGRMSGDIDRRIHETARFVLDVLAPNGFAPGGAAAISIGKVRLIHAAVRVAFSAHAPRGEADDIHGAATEGTPINQEEQVGTLCLFSVAVLKALARLGTRVEARQREDFVHLWRVVGAMLGIEEALLPTTFAHGEALLGTIRQRQEGASDEGRALMRTLLEGMERHLVVPHLAAVPRALICHLVGEDAAALLGLPLPASRARTLAIARSTAELVPRVGERLVHMLTASKLAGRPATFAMPTGLSG